MLENVILRRKVVSGPYPGQLPDRRPPCKSFVKRKQRTPDARVRGARKHISQITQLARVPLGGGSCFAEPDIHLLSQVFCETVTDD